MRRTPGEAAPPGGSGLRRAACGLMVAGAVGLVLAAMLGAPLVSVLIAGLLLLCPLLMWVPFRIDRRALDRVEGRRGE